jgi:hypothetical protein
MKRVLVLAAATALSLSAALGGTAAQASTAAGHNGGPQDW